MDPNQPQVEVIPNRQREFPRFRPHIPWYRTTRFIIFSIVFLISTVISLIYVFSRPPVYQSHAVLLTVAAAGIDERSTEADIEHVAIQRQMLTSQELLRGTIAKMQDTAYVELGEEIQMTVADLRQMLMVKTVTDTNLVELVAEGYRPKLLPFVINTWIDVYLKQRAEEIQQIATNTTGALGQELSNLEYQIQTKSRELDDFRRTYQIASIEREENQTLSRLKGLNESLNKANEEEVRALANLNAIKISISRGQLVVPKEDSSTIKGLQKNADSLREKLDELNQRYTKEYMALQPILKDLPKQLSDLETQIESLSEFGQKVVLSDAEREYEAARQSRLAIQRQLDGHKAAVSEFTMRFAQHDKLNNDLAGLEELFRESQQRLVKIEAKQQKRYPQLSVVDRAYLPRDPVRPNYFIDAIIATCGSFGFALLCVWVFSFLTKKESDNPDISLSTINMYENQSLGITQAQQGQTASLQRQSMQSLAAPEMSEVSFDDLQKLFELSNLKAQQLIALLFNGLTLTEISALTEEDFDYDQKTLFVAGESERVVPVPDKVINLFQNHTPNPAWQAKHEINNEDLDAILMCAVVDSGISHPDQVNSETLRHSYIIYLVRQGLKLSELEPIVGYLSPSKLSAYRSYSPPSRGRDIKEIEILHPALA